MADDPQPAESNAANPNKSGGGGMVPVLLIVVLMPAISFGMFKFLFVPMIKAEMPEAGEPAEIDPKNVTVHAAESGEVHRYSLEKIVTNLRGTSMTRYIQVGIAVESVNPELESIMEEHDARLRDVAETVLGSLTLADLERREIKNIVRNQIKQGFDHVLPEPMIDDIFFSSFVVQ